MKFTLSWLKEYLDTKASVLQIAEKLTQIGLEVETISDKSKELSAFEIAYIKNIRPHPNADKLRICNVETKDGELQVVCGAANAKQGINVVLAPVGSIIPTNGLKIKKSKIRDVESEGMLCSAAELGIGDDSSGIIEMAGDKRLIGKNYTKYVGLDDAVIELAITPNRGDCLGVYGIARDLAATGIGKLRPLIVKKSKSYGKSPVKVKILDKNGCQLFIGRYFKNVKNCASPVWLQNRLKAIGLRPVSALVDITNYLAFTFARPLHVYDANKLCGDIIVRKAKNNEKIKALNGCEYTLAAQDVVVADGKQVQALAGIIGGVDSACDEDTTEVFLEVALFDPVLVARTGRSLDIVTDSRYRFERKVDPLFVDKAVEIASTMITEFCGGKASSVVVAGKIPDAKKIIRFDPKMVQSLGGLALTEVKVKEILEKLGFTMSGSDVAVPSYRQDIEVAADLVEEVLRIHGYDKIPTLTVSQLSLNKETASWIITGKLRRALAYAGLNEVVTWSFANVDKLKEFGDVPLALYIKNPISSDLNAMRTSILPGILDTVARNMNRGIAGMGLFEIGPVFYDVTVAGQQLVASGVRVGEVVKKNIYSSSRKADFYDVKSDVFNALAVYGLDTDKLVLKREVPKYYHPGKSASISLGKKVIANFGELHPSLGKIFDIESKIMGFEIFLSNIPDSKGKYKRKKFIVNNMQVSVRDFAFLLDEEVSIESIIKAIKMVDSKLITDVYVFDVYRGKGIEDGKKSVAVSVKIEPYDRNLTDNDLEVLSRKLVDSVASRCGGIIRG